VDAKPPYVAALKLWPSQAALTRVSPVLFNLTFSEPVSGVTAALISTAGSGAGLSVGSVTVAQQGSGGAQYRVSVSLSGRGTLQLGISGNAGVLAAVLDGGGNGLLASALTTSLLFGESPAILRSLTLTVAIVQTTLLRRSCG
jgi:hypothetical protein